MLAREMTSLQSPPSSPATPQNDGTVMPYSAEFTDSIMKVILTPPPASGIEVIHPGTKVAPVQGSSIRLEDVHPATVEPAELPLRLDDARRVYKGSIPGVKLTHPGGPIEGGPPLSLSGDQIHRRGSFPPDMRQFAQQLIENNDIRTAAGLKKFITAETKRQKDELTRRMAERHEAIDHNEKLDREIKQMEDQRALERRVEAMLRKDA